MTAGRVVSLQVGTAGTLRFRGREIRTGIFKEPVEGPVALGPEGLDGDLQADRRHHGGPDNALCVHATEHLPDWEELIGRALPYGAFGENLSTAGLLETGVHVGDVFALGTATVQVSQPRSPCFKLATRWGKRSLITRMAKECRSGWYLRVLDTGAIAAGDELRLVERGSAITIAEVMRVTFVDRDDGEAIERVLAVPELAAQWRGALEARTANAAPPG